VAKSIDLGLRKSTTNATATTAQKKLSPIPPPAKASTSYTGTPPLPEGRVVSAISPSSLTPAERETMELIGWTDDVPIPSNMQQILAAVVKEKTAQIENMPLQVDPRTPPIHLKPRPLADLTPAEKERILHAMKVSFEEEKARKDQDTNQKMLEVKEQSVPGLNAAMQTAKKAAAYQEFAGSPEPLSAETKTAIPTPAPAPTVASASAATEVPINEPTSDTGAIPQLSFCPHCSWDLGAPVVPEPAYGDKMSFLHALLGEKPWSKEIELFGGNVKVTFRTLTTQEIDVIYRQAYQDRRLGQINTDNDFWERINRFRLFLQLQSMRTQGDLNGFSHDLPDGLSKETNPGAVGFWTSPDDALTQDETTLPHIEKWITENVLRNEAIFRVVSQAANQFNRVAAKMEAMADNSDFWQPTEAQS
jgi:hypothetical protein